MVTDFIHKLQAQFFQVAVKVIFSNSKKYSCFLTSIYNFAEVLLISQILLMTLALGRGVVVNHRKK